MTVTLLSVQTLTIPPSCSPRTAMSDCTDDEAPSDTVCLSSLLGIKGGLRLRRDPTEQRPHIILRRVVEEDSDDSSDEEETPAPRKTRVEFRLYSHKHLNLKPGRELLLTVESENDAFEKQLFTFEGDIDASDEDSELEDTTVAEEPAQVDDDEEVDLPYAAMPPKLRRRELLTKKDEVSRVVQLPVKRTVAHASVGVQTTTSSYASTSVQAIPSQLSVAQQTTPTLYASTSAQTQSMQAEFLTPPQSVVATSLQTQSDLSFSNPLAYRPSLTIDIPCVESGDEMEISPVGSDIPLNESFPSSPSHAVPDSDHSSSPTLVSSDLATGSPHEAVSKKSILHFETKAQARDSIAPEVPDEPMPSSADACPPRLPTPESVIRRRQATKVPPTEPAAFRAAAASASGGTPLPTGPSALRKATATASCSRPPAPPPNVPPPPLPMIPRGVVISAKGKERAPEESEATVVDIAEAKEAAAVVISTGPYSNRLNIRPSSSSAVIIPPQPRPADSSTSSSTAQKKKVVINVGGPIVARTKKGSAGTHINKDAARAKVIDIDYASRSPSPETGSCNVEPENKWKRIAPVFVPASVGHVPVAPPKSVTAVDPQAQPVRKNVFEIEEEKQAVGRAASKDKSTNRNDCEPSRKKRKVDGDQSVNSEVPASSSLPNSPSKSQPVLAHPLPMKPPTDLSGSLRRIKRERSPSPVLTLADTGRPPVRSSKRDRSRSADSRQSSRQNEPERPWKAIQASDVCALGGDGALGVVQIVFNSDGSRFALLCENNTLRIWDSVYMLELARLSLSSTAELAWMEKDLVSLSRDGVVRKWKQKGSHWERVPLVCLAPEHCSEDDKLCLAVARGRIAVSSPRFGVNAWIWTNGAWVAQRAIARTKVTALKFIDGGDALVGGTLEGVVWHSAVPNGTLKAYAFLQSGITSIAISPTGSEAVVSQAHGPACTVLLGPQESKRLKQAYADAGSVTVGAQFTSNGNLIVYGTPEGCLAFCDKQTGSIVYRTENQEGDIQVMACCEGPRPSVLIGTQRGRLVRWEAPRYQPVVGGRRKRSKLK
ncbi:hypothetical protein HMN09_00100800 [Mycena chlorophos]|uniref:WD40 repeat-like protein n=1 Tax=Mycena chlorophos TaxID=658473 RepID=A0A8H6TQA6_MYCCL|nr:hypothetical protein HMN09_00100800 [Mycena chlorophos]